MVFLSFLNLGLAYLFYIFAAYMDVPVGMSIAGGLALSLLLLYLHKEGSLTAVSLAVVASFALVVGLYYSYTPGGASVLKFSFLGLTALFAFTAMSTMLAMSINFEPGKHVRNIALKFMAVCVTAFNGLPLVSYLWTIATA